MSKGKVTAFSFRIEHDVPSGTREPTERGESGEQSGDESVNYRGFRRCPIG